MLSSLPPAPILLPRSRHHSLHNTCIMGSSILYLYVMHSINKGHFAGEVYFGSEFLHFKTYSNDHVLRKIWLILFLPIKRPETLISFFIFFIHFSFESWIMHFYRYPEKCPLDMMKCHHINTSPIKDTNFIFPHQLQDLTFTLCMWEDEVHVNHNGGFQLE